jgi:hypothetical protein
VDFWMCRFELADYLTLQVYIISLWTLAHLPTTRISVKIHEFHPN